MEEMYNCTWCATDIQDQDIFFFDDNHDQAYCSENCVQSAEVEGLSRWEAQQEDLDRFEV